MAAIRLMLDLSTAHLPDDLRDTLGHRPNVIAQHLTYGWLLHVPTHPDDTTQTKTAAPDVVVTIERYARSLGCDYVLFDRDAEVDDQLPIWE